MPDYTNPFSSVEKKPGIMSIDFVSKVQETNQKRIFSATGFLIGAGVVILGLLGLAAFTKPTRADNY